MHMIKKTVYAFALLEVAIALSVLGVIAYMGMPLISKLSNWQHTRTTTAHQEQIMEALGAYVLANNRLPCPAANSSGKAEPGTSIGFVPYQTLGISEKTAKDGQHHWMTYAVQSSLASAHVMYVQDPGVEMDPQSIFCAANALGTLTINNDKNEPCVVGADFAALAIVAHGSSGGYYLDNGTIQLVNSTDVDKTTNASRTGIFVTKTATHNGLNTFDDTIIFASRNNLMANWSKCPCKLPD